MTRWAMVIDLTKCVGCRTCIQVCKDANRAPAAWRQSANHLLHISSDEQEFFFTFSCMHCENPSCLKVCPTSATHRRPDGIVDIDSDLCVGCGACIAACPYDARSIASRDQTMPKGSKQDGENKRFADRIGICTKCDFCRHRVNDGIARGLVPGVDKEATPNCVRYCIAEALHFGDLDDPTSNVSTLLNARRSFKLREDLYNLPSVYYLL